MLFDKNLIATTMCKQGHYIEASLLRLMLWITILPTACWFDIQIIVLDYTKTTIFCTMDIIIIIFFFAINLSICIVWDSLVCLQCVS